MKIYKLVIVAAFISALAMSASSSSYSQENATATDEQKKIIPPSKFNGIIQDINASKDEKTLRDLIDDAFSESGAYENYDKFIADAGAALAADPAFNNQDYLNYAMARARFDQLSSLAKNNDIEAGRLYMSVNDKYFSEAMDYLGKADSATKSKSLLIDSNLLKFMIFKEKLQPEKSDAAFDLIASQIAKYSDDPAINRKKLEDIFVRFKKLGLTKQAIKMKILYASKVGPEAAREVIEEIRKSADRYFDQNDMKEAADLYEQYMATAVGYYDKEIMGTKIMEVGEKYFGAGRYKDAKKYYGLYMEKYSDLAPADYCSYKLALASYYMKDHIRTLSQLEAFLEKYKNSAWFDRAFEMLARVYYENLPREKAIESIQSIIDKYYRDNAGDYAQILMAMLYYKATNFDSAEDRLKKIGPSSSCYYAAQTIINDIKEIKNNKTAPMFGTDATDTYKTWEPYQGIDVKISPALAAGADKGKTINVVTSGDGSIQIDVDKGAKIQFGLQGMVDEDKFNEYTIDKDDQSRLPKMVREETEKDLLLLHWAVDGGNFTDDKQADTRIWQAPDEPGIYKMKVSIDDFGVVRVPNKGVRKDEAKDITLSIVVK